MAWAGHSSPTWPWAISHSLFLCCLCVTVTLSPQRFVFAYCKRLRNVCCKGDSFYVESWEERSSDRAEQKASGTGPSRCYGKDVSCGQQRSMEQMLSPFSMRHSDINTPGGEQGGQRVKHAVDVNTLWLTILQSGYGNWAVINRVPFATLFNQSESKPREQPSV